MERWATFLELNGDDVAEARQLPLRQAYYWLYRAISRGGFVRRAAGLSPFSRACEPSPLCPLRSSDHRDRERYRPFALRAVACTKHEGFGFFLGAKRCAKWHGASKILDLARLRPGWTFDLIGMTADDLESPVPPNVNAHGILDAMKYQRVLAS